MKNVAPWALYSLNILAKSFSTNTLPCSGIIFGTETAIPQERPADSKFFTTPLKMNKTFSLLSCSIDFSTIISDNKVAVILPDMEILYK